MCGIFGVFGSGAETCSARAALASGALAHRGPDAEGGWRGEGVLLGHRRLSILDLAERANQPMRRGPLRIVFNGEIYNFQLLRRQLEAKGETFETTSDTEVLLVGLLRDGLDFLERVEGMFAFALHDERDRSLLLARDRYGEKPLYVHETPGRVTFSSELAGIEALSEKPLEEDADAIALFFRLSYIPAPLSALAGTSQLEPGSWRRYSLDLVRADGRYYTLPRPPITNLGYAEACAKVREGVSNSVDLRLKTADVPVATLLSGGLDSTIVTLLAHRLSAKPVTAYSLSFPDEPAFDEGKFALEVAKGAPGLDHRLIPARVDDLLSFTDRLFETLSEPLADASLVPTAFLISHIQEKVVLGGDGADEVYAGYGTYASMRASARLPDALKRLMLLMPAHRAPSRIRSPLLRAAALFHSNLAMDPVAEYLLWRNYARPSELNRLGLDRDVADILRAGVNEVAGGTLRDVQLADIAFNLPNDMLRKVDIAGMAFGVEARLPYLDREVVHFALSTPDDFRLRAGVRKRILRDAFADLVPSSILARRKMGFLMPIRQWMSAGPMRDALLDLGRSQTRFDPGVIERLVLEHSKGLSDHSVLLWALYVYFRWSAGRAARIGSV